ncbi:MAG TPA: RNA polymerase sigma-70 factor [Bacteroidales bacterium]
MNTSNLELKEHTLTRLKEGDMNSFEEVFTIFQPKLLAFVYRYLKSKEDSEEIVQEVFIQIWENRTTLNEKLSFKSYLFTITKNRIIDYFRKKKIETLSKNYVRNFTELIHDNTSSELVYKDYDAVLAEAIEKLPDKRKVIFLLSRKFGMSRNEIANFFNISENTVKNQLQEALNFLRDILKKEVLLIILLIINRLF